jgi:ATP-dependent RNA helicase RhlE
LTSFNDLGLNGPILRALDDERHTTPTPIQAQAIPHVMAGRDLLGIAQTGTGKTAAFALPILHRLSGTKYGAQPRTARILVLSPTRELSGQILERFRAYGRHISFRSTLVIGGVPMGKQIRAMAQGNDVVIATPGRLLDLVEQKALSLDAVEVLVLDEVDQMLDLGFIHAIRAIVARLPKVRQNLFFSATMPPEIAKLAGQLLTDPVRVAVTPVAKTADRVAQQAMFVEARSKGAALAKILADPAVERTLVFTRTKHGADKVVRHLDQAGIAAQAIHGNKSQPQRERTMAAFRAGRIRVLVATDIAARGIDVENISHVINHDLPHVPESYVHRIGRTARAGAGGQAIALVSREEMPLLRAIEKLIRQSIPVVGAPAIATAAPVRAEAIEALAQNDGPRGRPHEGRRPHVRQDGRPQRRRGERVKYGDRQAGRGQTQGSALAARGAKSQPSALAAMVQREALAGDRPQSEGRPRQNPNGRPERQRDGRPFRFRKRTGNRPAGKGAALEA